MENNMKKSKNIPFPMTKLKSSIPSNTLFLNQNKKQKNSNTNNNNNNQHKKLNKKKNILSNKTKYLNPTKTIELIQNNNDIKAILTKNKNSFNNINRNKNNNNKIYQLEQNTIDYFVNSSNSIKKKRCSSSVHEQRKKIMNDIYSKKHQHKEKEINCLKLSSNNTNSTSINTNNTINFNSKNSKIKNTLSANIEEMKKENKTLKSKIEIINKENRTLNKKIIKLREKNLEYRNILYTLKKEKDDYSQSITQSLKLLKLLKKKGLDLSEIMENLSNSNSENEEENEQDNLNDKIEFMDYFSENDKNNIDKDNDNNSAFTDISFGRLDCHEEFSVKKIPKGLKNIPRLKIYNINQDNFQ